MASESLAGKSYGANLNMTTISSKHWHRSTRHMRKSLLFYVGLVSVTLNSSKEADYGWKGTISTTSSVLLKLPKNWVSTRFWKVPIRGGSGDTTVNNDRYESYVITSTVSPPSKEESAPSLATVAANISGCKESTLTLWEAARVGSQEMLRQAISHGADVNARNEKHCRWGALHYAVHHDDPNLLSLLIEAGARVDLPCNLRVRALHLAAVNGSAKAAEFLLKVGANPNPPDQYGRTPLHYAAGVGHSNVVNIILAYGGNADAQDCVAATPLAAAARGGHIEVVGTLVSSGGNVRLEDRFGCTPSGAAVKKGHFAAAALCRVTDHGRNKVFASKEDALRAMAADMLAGRRNTSRAEGSRLADEFWQDEIK